MSRNNSKKNREYHKKWYWSLSPEERKLHNKKRAIRYRKQLDGYQKRYRKERPEIRQANQANARVRRFYKFAGTIPNKDLLKFILENKNKECIYCGDNATQIDHIIPLSIGGKHSLDNLEMICKTCNFAKGNKTKVDFLKWIKNLVERNK